MEAASHQRTSQNTPGDNTTLNTPRVTHLRSQLHWMESPGDFGEVVSSKLSAHIGRVKQAEMRLSVKQSKYQFLGIYFFTSK